MAKVSPKLLPTLFFIIIINCLGVPNAFCGFLSLPRDAQGWTIFTPSSDSRIMYVSADGDANGVVYGASSFADPFNPSGEHAFATFDQAYANFRKGYPDWILFRRGDTFKDQYKYYTQPVKGRSLTEPSLIGAYGSTGDCPVWAGPADQKAFWMGNDSYFALVNIDFYAYTRDPNSPDYIEASGAQGLYMRAGAFTVEGVLVEGCKFRFFTGNEASDLNRSEGGILDIQFRRCSFLDSYGMRYGLYSKGTRNLQIYQCIFDHNGGSGADFSPTIFDHGIYLEVPTYPDIQETIIMRSASGGVKHTNYQSNLPTPDFKINNCLFLDNEFAATSGTGPGIVNSTVQFTWTNNVISNLSRSTHTGRGFAAGFPINSFENSSISNNLFTNQPLELANAQNLIQMTTDGGSLTPANLTISGNIFYNLRGMSGIASGNNIVASGMIVSNNKFQIPQNAGYTCRMNSVSGWSFSGNQYYSDRSDGTRFAISGSNKTNAQWAAATGDNSEFIKSSFPDPDRSIETYMANIGQTASIDAFINKCRSQGRYNWDNRYTASAVNSYLRAGFFQASEKAPIYSPMRLRIKNP